MYTHGSCLLQWMLAAMYLLFNRVKSLDAHDFYSLLSDAFSYALYVLMVKFVVN